MTVDLHLMVNENQGKENWAFSGNKKESPVSKPSIMYFDEAGTKLDAFWT